MSLINIISYSLIMVIGPQLLVPITLILNKNIKKVSISYILGVFTSTFVTITIFTLLFNIFGKQLDSLFTYQGNGLIKILLVSMLIFLTIKCFIKRKEKSKSKFIEVAINGNASTIFKIAIILFSIFPTDLMVNIAVAKFIAIDGYSFILTVVPLAALNALIVSIPYILYLIFKESIIEKIPKVRKKLEDNVWIINILLYLAFIYLLLS